MTTHTNGSFLNWVSHNGEMATTLQSVLLSDVNTHGTKNLDNEVQNIQNGTVVTEQAPSIAIYPGYAFEVPVYLFIWPVLVLITCGLNVIVCVVLLKKKMRSLTNTILAAISVSDSLTGLVTIPVYLMVYSKWEGAKSNVQGASNYTYEDYDMAALPNTSYAYYNYKDVNNYMDEKDNVSKAAYILSASLCRSFMLTRHFVSMSFHTISIWLTLFLGFQRFCIVRFPFDSQKWLCKRNIVIVCVIVCVLAPILHVYHLFDEKVTHQGFCEWRVEEGCVDFGCVYIWLSLLLKQFFPCVILLVLTIVFIIHLKKGSEAFDRSDSSASRRKQRKRENKRISVIVVLIVVLFLIPEVPYGIFLLYVALTRESTTEMDLETNREIIAAYEILLVLSFHANFWIYLGFNSHFRDELKITLFSPFYEIQRRISLSSRGSFSRSPKSPSKPTDETNSKSNIELHRIENAEREKLNSDRNE